MSAAQGVPAVDAVVGDTLPELRLPITRTLIVSGAIASRDYQDVHHDPSLAQQRGAPDIFVNILTTNGFIGRFVTDWAGPDARLTKVALRLGTPAHPGDELILNASVTERVGADLALAVTGRVARGIHVTATVSVTLTEGARA